MARRRAPTPGAQWGVLVEMQPQETIAIYNRKRTAEEEHLTMAKDEVYSGLLRFICYMDGANTAKSHDLHVTSEMTCSDVVPLLSQQLETNVNGMSQPAGHILLVQGEMERVLEDTDKPLEIALDCSSKGLASPKFLFRLPVDPLTPDGSPSHRMRTSGFTSYVGALTAHSNPNLAVTPSSLPAPNLSPHLPAALDRNRWLSTDGEQNSLYSTDSYTSLSSPGRPVHRLQHMSKSVSALEQVPKSSPLKRKPMHMLSENGHQNGSPAISRSAQNFLQLPQATTPQSPSTKMTRAKNSVGSFFSRSLRNNRKAKSKSKSSKSMYSGTDSGSHGNLYLPPVSPEERQASVMVTNLVSPILAERKITMSTVMHIHYRDTRDALVYKSLLVSHKTKARDVVKEALQRFDMTGANPKDFCLFEVVGHWQDVSQRVELQSSLKSGAAALSLSSTSLLTAPRPAVTSIEEFVECYSRPIGPSERPYNLQTCLATQEGYTRRFELRRQDSALVASRVKSRSHEALLDEKETERHQRVSAEVVSSKRLSWADNEFCKGASPLFGDTSHRKRGKRQNQILRSSLGSAVQEGSETEEDILDEVKSRRRAVSTGGTCKVSLRQEKVRESQPDSLLVDEGDPFAPEVSTPRRRKVLLSATSSSPDSGVVSFSKDKKVRHNSDELSSSARSGNRLESASVFNDTPTHTSSLSHTQLLKTPFLLNLKMSDVEKEPLVQPLEAERVSIMSSAAFKPEELEGGGCRQCVCLHHPDLANDSRPFCLLQLQTIGDYSADHSAGGRVYILHPIHPEFPVHLNGNLVVEPTTLSHGDLLSLHKDRYLFLFQDYSTAHSTQQYSWRPHPSSHILPSSPLLLSTPLPSSPLITDVSTRGGEQSKGSLEREDNKRSAAGDETPQQGERHSLRHQHSEPAAVSLHRPSSSGPTPTDTTNHTDAACQTPTPQQERRHVVPDHHRGGEDDQRPGSVDSARGRHERHADTESMWFYSLQRPPKKTHRSHRNLSSSDSPVSPVPSFSPSRKSLFSFNLGEEDTILRHLVSDLDVSQTPCYLGPALLLAMCTEYCHKCHGLAPTSRFVHKTVDSVQEVVWRCTERLTKWKPDPAMASRPVSHCEDLFPLLQPTVFWLANGLELHHLLTHSCTPLPPLSSSSSNDPLSTLHSALMYTFQQMFYTASKVLFYSLPLVLDGYKNQSEGEEDGKKVVEGGGEDEIVEQAVDFLQALLNLMTNLQLHLQVVSCFYANLFFFINTTLFNSVMQLGPQRGVFTHSAGTTLRSSLTLLEGWACQVGFKDAVLHHLAKLSSILDILATPPQQLLQMSWDDLREEFPVLHPAQLHHLLSHYVPPPSLSPPSTWSPTHTDLSAAKDRALVNESYDTHPGFTLPEASYSLSLSKTPPQHLQFQTLVDTLHESLRQNSKNDDVLPVVESAPSAQMPTILTSLPTPPAITTSHPHNHHHHHRNHQHKTSSSKDGTHHRTGHKRRSSKKEVKRETDSDMNENGPQTFAHALSHDSLTSDPLNNSHTGSSIANDVSGIGSNTESQEDLLDSTRNGKNRRNCRSQKTMGEKTNSASKVADLICSYEETAKLSQSSSESVKITRVVGEGEGVERGKVGRVMSMVTDHAFSQPQTLILQEYDIEEWASPSFPDGAHFVNVQRGTKGFGILLVEQKEPVTGTTATFIQQVLPGSTADQCKDLKAGDRVLAIDGQLLDGADYCIAEKYLKEAEDDVQLVLAPRPLTLMTQ